MTHTACVVVDPGAVRPTEALRELVDSAPLVCITGRAMADLARELGGYEAAARHLVGLATLVGRPLGVNVPAADGESSTMFVAPHSWGEGRLRGWLEGHREILGEMFGEVSRVYRYGEARR